jgi:E3 ubiquitin-protein ligase BOI-like protein
MDGEAFRVGAHLRSLHPSAAMEDPIQTQNQNQFLFNAKSTPLQLQLFGSPAGKMDNASAYSSLRDFS